MGLSAEKRNYWPGMGAVLALRSVEFILETAFKTPHLKTRVQKPLQLKIVSLPKIDAIMGQWPKNK